MPTGLLLHKRGHVRRPQLGYIQATRAKYLSEKSAGEESQVDDRLLGQIAFLEEKPFVITQQLLGWTWPRCFDFRSGSDPTEHGQAPLQRGGCKNVTTPDPSQKGAGNCLVYVSDAKTLSLKPAPKLF